MWLGVLLAAGIVGAVLRLDQFGAQVLIDDEWHAVHQLLHHTPQTMFFDFGFADYSIPLGILYWYEAHGWGLSEIGMRWPMLLCGLATLVVLPLYVAPRLGGATAAVFALLIAISPLLVVYSRMARPYAITLLFGWIAHGAFQRYHASTQWPDARRAHLRRRRGAVDLAAPDHRPVRAGPAALGARVAAPRGAGRATRCASSAWRAWGSRPAS